MNVYVILLAVTIAAIAATVDDPSSVLDKLDCDVHERHRRSRRCKRNLFPDT
jgi:hypothetical protein